MISVQKFIFPGIAAGCLFVVMVASLIANPQTALAFSESTSKETPTPEVVETEQVDQPNPELTQEVTQNPPLPLEQSLASEAESAPASSGECSLSTAYSESVRQWCGLIEQYAGQNGLDPNLIAAVMTQESGGNAQAYSKDGAVGLLQVMPSDGKAANFMCVNGPCFASRPSSAELYDPEFNISYGTSMLAGLVQRRGSIREALRSYGPMNMGYRYADIVLGIMERNR